MLDRLGGSDLEDIVGHERRDVDVVGGVDIETDGAIRRVSAVTAGPHDLRDLQVWSDLEHALIARGCSAGADVEIALRIEHDAVRVTHGVRRARPARIEYYEDRWLVDADRDGRIPATPVVCNSGERRAARKAADSQTRTEIDGRCGILNHLAVRRSPARVAARVRVPAPHGHEGIRADVIDASTDPIACREADVAHANADQCHEARVVELPAPLVASLGKVHLVVITAGIAHPEHEPKRV